jgi:benzoyl-CoA-dihydrodiol lyase
VRRDLADVFCSTTEGVRADRAKQWNLVDRIAKPQQFHEAVSERTGALVAQSSRTGSRKGIELTEIERIIDDDGYHYKHVDVALDRAARTLSLTIRAPTPGQPQGIPSIHARGAQWWPLAMARELDDAILLLRTNEPDIGLWLLKTEGDIEQMLAMDSLLLRFSTDWLVKETIGLLRRTLARLDVSSRTLFAIIDQGSCFAGTLFELALAADRSYMLLSEQNAPRIALSEMNFGAYPAVNHRTRLLTRFCGDQIPVDAAHGVVGNQLPASLALELGLVSFTPDDIDWIDEVRLAVEERASLSPDALTAMEASLRFPGAETMESRIFGRLSAWQNWVFSRPNAVGEQGALKVFGTGSKAKFNWERI